MKMSKFAYLFLGTGSAVLSVAAAAQSKKPSAAFCTSSHPDKTLITNIFMTNLIQSDHEILRKKWIAYTSATYGQGNERDLGCEIHEWPVGGQIIKNRKGFLNFLKGWQRPMPQAISWRPQEDAVKGEAEMLAQVNQGMALTSPQSEASGSSVSEERNLPDSRNAEQDKKADSKPAASKPAVAPSKYVEVSGPNGETIRLSPEVAARNQAAAEEYRRQTEAHERAKAEAKADQDRKLAEHQENAAKAAAAKQAHEQKLAANAAEVAAHKAAMDDYKKKLAGKASTDDDPNRCITSPAIKPGLRGNTEVHVTNGCDQKVDIVICLKRTSGDWLCGARFGILSQRSMSFMSTNATGEIYVDAVTFGSKQKLGRPAGIIK